jgi:radical SAM protein with 4Fe4S-binding SPASM domain
MPPPSPKEAGSPVLATPLKLTISITQQCNLRCRHCYARCGARPLDEELSTGEWLALLDDLEANGFVQVFFEGGEPFARDGFLEVLRAACPRFLTWVRTNATLIDAGLAGDLARMGVGTACVDVLDTTPEVHDGLTGVPGSHERTISGVRHLIDAGVPVFLLLILNRENHRGLQRYLEFAHDLGARAVGILRLYPLGRAKDNWGELALSLDEMTAALRSYVPPPGLRVMNSWHPYDGNCCYQNAAVSPFGDSIGCPYLREYVDYGNVRDTPFLETWDHPLYRRLRKGAVHAACSDCTTTQHSSGGCRSTAYAFTGDWDAGDPFCPTLNEGLDLRVLPG